MMQLKIMMISSLLIGVLIILFGSYKLIFGKSRNERDGSKLYLFVGSFLLLLYGILCILINSYK